MVRPDCELLAGCKAWLCGKGALRSVPAGLAKPLRRGLAVKLDSEAQQLEWQLHMRCLDKLHVHGCLHACGAAAAATLLPPPPPCCHCRVHDRMPAGLPVACRRLWR